MTTTYDPNLPGYLDEADVRHELTRVFDICHGCRQCVDLCASFPTLFDLIGRTTDREAGLLTPSQQDRVVDECFQCGSCSVDCPYTPGRHEWQVDVPRLVVRARAMRYATDQQSIRDRVTTQVLSRTDLVGTVACRVPSIANRVVTARPGSFVRTLVAMLTGVSAVRMLSPYARQRFSTWFRHRTAAAPGHRGRVTVFPTCLVEYRQPEIGRDLVRVYERNGVDCEISEAGCCGAPWLHAGDIGHFRAVAVKNVRALAREVRRGDIVVPQPTCGDVIRNEYVAFVGGPDAELVAAHTFDAAEHLMHLHRGAGGALDTDFPGDVPDTVTYHLACHQHAQQIGMPSRDLIELTGARVEVVRQCSGIGDAWGRRSAHDDSSTPIAEQLGQRIIEAGGGRRGNVVCGDCHFANTAVAEQVGATPVHPIQLVARAYGIPSDDRRDL